MTEILLKLAGAQLPDLSRRREAAVLEQLHSIDRLEREWASGINRFDRCGEALLFATVAGDVVGVGGVTIEPSDPPALRVRRFYVIPSFRGRGVGTAIAHRLIRQVPAGTMLTAHAGSTAAAQFWERLDVVPVADRPYSHELRLSA